MQVVKRGVDGWVVVAVELQLLLLKPWSRIISPLSVSIAIAEVGMIPPPRIVCVAVGIVLLPVLISQVVNLFLLFIIVGKVFT